MIDIDHFKEINDSFGHQVGDKVILGVAEVLMNNSREYDSKSRYAGTSNTASSIRLYDVPGRYGGDEFALLLPYCSEDEAMIVAERIRRRIEEIDVSDIHGLSIRASLGGAVFGPDLGGAATAEELMHNADSALYEAKTSGRGRTVFASHI
jgi:PleD family two-component response regulator